MTQTLNAKFGKNINKAERELDMDVRYYPVQFDNNSGVIIHSEQGVDTYAEAEQKVYEGNAAEISVGLPQTWVLCILISETARGSSSILKSYFLDQEGVRDASWRILAVTADDRIHESVLASSGPVDGWSPEEFDGWQDAPTD